MSAPDPVGPWIDALIDRHTAPFTSAEFLKAVRALSARYVEQRQQLAERRPTDTAGKRAAFAAFFAPLHFFTARAVVGALGISAVHQQTVIDLGCGTGVVGAACALSAVGRPRVWGIDRDAWALQEAQWNWRALGIDGRVRRFDLGQALVPILTSGRVTPRPGTTIALGWAANELASDRLDRLLDELLAAHGRGASVLVIEPLARGVSPWWPRWADVVASHDGRADEWKFDVTLPPRLAELDRAAGFDRPALGARSLWLPGSASEPTR